MYGKGEGFIPLNPYILLEMNCIFHTLTLCLIGR